MSAKTSNKPPTVERVERSLTVQGRTRSDPYAWLRDDNWQRVMRQPEVLKSEIRKHLLRENAHTEAALAPVADLRKELFEELKARFEQDESSVPARDGAFEYYVRYERGAQHPRYCRREASAGRVRALDAGVTPQGETVLFDAEAASKQHTYFSTRGVTHSRDHRKLCVGVDTRGSEYFELSFVDLESGRTLPDRIQHTSGRACFSEDGRTLFYVKVDSHHRPSKVYRHHLGTPADADVLVYDEPDPGFFVSVETTEDHQYVLIVSHDHTTSEARFIAADQPEAAPKLLAKRRPGVEYDVSILPDGFLLLTNDAAEDFKLVRASFGRTAPEHWHTVVPHRPGCMIASAMAFSKHIVRLEVEGALPRIVVRRLADGVEHTIEFDEPAFDLGLVPGYEYHTQLLRFTYSSPTTPTQTFEYDLESRARRLLKKRRVPSGHDPARFRCDRVFATSHDGEQVPITLLRHADTPLDGRAPLLLYAYGSYGHSVPASFSENRLSLVQRGFVYAIAHVRGGKEKGYSWYSRGKLLQKKNTFFDFIACAEHLARTGHATSGNITIHGGSAGGMLVGVAVNLRPELFRAAVAQVPFVDVLNTMCDHELPLTPPEWREWGNPLSDPEAYDYIASYSPYDNVEPKAYPHVLATAGLTDPRVTYWEPAKWVARLREHRTNDKLLLLHTYMQAGHGGAAGRFEKLHEVALVYAFILLAHDHTKAMVCPAS